MVMQLNKLRCCSLSTIYLESMSPQKGNLLKFASRILCMCVSFFFLCILVGGCFAGGRNIDCLTKPADLRCFFFPIFLFLFQYEYWTHATVSLSQYPTCVTPVQHKANHKPCHKSYHCEVFIRFLFKHCQKGVDSAKGYILR